MTHTSTNEQSTDYYMDVEDTWISGRRHKEAVITYVAEDGGETCVKGINYIGPAHPRGAFDQAAAIAKLWPAVLFLRDYKERTGKRFEIADKRSLSQVLAARKRRKDHPAKVEQLPVP